MILYFSGTGNSEYAAERIGGEMGDEVLNLFGKIRDNDVSEVNSETPWVVVTPTYAWRIPHLVENWLKNTALTGNRDAYFVMTCGGSVGNAGQYLESLCKKKGLRYKGCLELVMPENYIAMFATPTKSEALETIAKAEETLTRGIAYLKNGEPFPKPPVTLRDKMNSGIVNAGFYPLFVHAKKFYATENCISCGMCEKVCPMGNISVKNGAPSWGNNCTHCMACICRCPKEAIEYGKHSQGLPRYTCPK